MTVQSQQSAVTCICSSVLYNW